MGASAARASVGVMVDDLRFFVKRL